MEEVEAEKTSLALRKLECETSDSANKWLSWPGLAWAGCFCSRLRNASSLWAAATASHIEPLSRLYRMLATVAVAVTFVVAVIVVAVVVAVRPKDNA